MAFFVVRAFWCTMGPVVWAVMEIGRWLEGGAEEQDAAMAGETSETTPGRPPRQKIEICVGVRRGWVERISADRIVWLAGTIGTSLAGPAKRNQPADSGSRRLRREITTPGCSEITAAALEIRIYQILPRIVPVP